MITEPIAPARELAGRAPRGMWWVAWRQHRFAVLVSLALVALMAAAMVAFGLAYRSALTAANLVPDACSGQSGGSIETCLATWARVHDYGAGWALLRLPMVFLPVLIGVLVGASVIGIDREHGTQVFALTQSVGRTRWYLTKCVVAGGPPLLALLGVGWLASWAGSAGGLVFSWMAVPDFQTSGLMPAAFALLGFGLSVPAGALLRSTIAAVALATAVAALLVAGLGYTSYTDLVPHDRVVYAADRDGWVPMTDGSLYLDAGFLDADGNDNVGQSLSCSLYGPGSEASVTTDDRIQAMWQDCLDRAGIVARYTDYLDAGRWAQLTAVIGGICAALAAIGLALGWARVRRRVL